MDNATTSPEEQRNIFDSGDHDGPSALVMGYFNGYECHLTT
jgi:hypothetical protein